MSSEHSEMFNVQLQPGNLLSSLEEGPGVDKAGLCDVTEVCVVLPSELGPPTPHMQQLTPREAWAAQEQSLALCTAQPRSPSGGAEMFQIPLPAFRQIYHLKLL